MMLLLLWLLFMLPGLWLLAPWCSSWNLWVRLENPNLGIVWEKGEEGGEGVRCVQYACVAGVVPELYGHIGNVRCWLLCRCVVVQGGG